MVKTMYGGEAHSTSYYLDNCYSCSSQHCWNGLACGNIWELERRPSGSDSLFTGGYIPPVPLGHYTNIQPVRETSVVMISMWWGTAPNQTPSVSVFAWLELPCLFYIAYQRLHCFLFFFSLLHIFKECFWVKKANGEYSHQICPWSNINVNRTVNI